MENVEASKVMYGTFTDLWFDGYKIGEATECKATLAADKVEIKLARHMGKCYKVTGYTGKGSVKMHKVSSYMIKKIAPSIKQGKQVLIELVSKVADPDAIGTERVALHKVMFDAVDLINWSVGKVGEEDYNFTFEDYDLLDAAE